MKKITRAHQANPEPRSRRTLQLSHEIVRVLSPTSLARANGGAACDTGSNPTQNPSPTLDCPHTDNSGGTTTTPVTG